jgi:hypothetical protein
VTIRKTARAILPLLLLGALALPSPAQAGPACDADQCLTVITGPDGSYELKIGANSIGFFYEELDGCTWAVEAQYGDGSEPGEYVFSETEGLEAAHTYPAPGVYTFDAYATEGLHDGSSEPCPDIHIQATVTYPEPPPPKEPEEPAKGPAGGSGAAAPPQAQLPDIQLPAAATDRFWRDCGNEIRAHRLPCPKARRVIGAARSVLTRARPSERLAQGAVFKAEGFSCRLRDDAAGSVSCWRGRQRALGT